MEPSFKETLSFVRQSGVYYNTLKRVPYKKMVCSLSLLKPRSMRMIMVLKT